MDFRMKASRLSVSCYLVIGITFTVIACKRLTEVSWGFALGDLVFTAFWFFLAYRVSRHPIFLIQGEIVEVLTSGILPMSKFQIKDMQDIKTGRFGTIVVLHDGRNVRLPLSLLRKAERDVVVDNIKSLIAQSAENNPT